MGPSVATPEQIEALIQAGMNVARLNFSHGTHEEHGHMIHMLKAARAKLGVPLAIMLDTKGPEMRLGRLKKAEIELKEGSRVWLVKEEIEGDESRITLRPPAAFDCLKKEMLVLLDDGYIITHVVAVDSRGVQVEVDHGGVMKPSRGVNIPGAEVDLPPMTQKDIEDIRFGCSQDIDLIAASFIRSPEHVMAIKQLLEKEGHPDISVIAKVENKEGVQAFDGIVQVADGIMVARGDLGVELPLSQVPRLQKMMIRKSYLAAKSSVTATQMLESMIKNPRPTRAEASDVANAIYDSTSAVMLSGETAVGKYPIQAVKMMRSIIEEAETDFGYYDFFKQTSQRAFYDVPSSVAIATINTAYSSNAKAIFVFTTTGSTARLLSRLRPEMPILAMTPSMKVYHQLAISWGVIPIFCQGVHTIEEAKQKITKFALEKGYVGYGDLVIITAGTPFGRAGTTNMMVVDSIGDVLVRGSEGLGEKVHGKVFLQPSPDTKEYAVKGKILVLTRCDETYLPLLKQAAGVLLHSHIEDTESENYLKHTAQALNLPILLRAEGASDILRNEQLITLYPSQALVYKGAL